MAPWQRWHPRATLVLVVPALALIAAGNTLGGVSPYSYPVYFLLLFLWVGLDHPPWTGLAVAPLATGAYLLPALLQSRGDALVTSVTVAIPVGVLIAEVLSRTVARLGETQATMQRLLALSRRLGAFTSRMSSLEVSEVGGAVMEAMEELGYVAGAIVWFDGATMRVVARSGFPDDGGTTSVAEALAGRVVAADRTLVVDGAAQAGGPRVPAGAGSGSVIATPIRRDTGIVGMLVGARPHRAGADTSDAETFELLAAHAGPALVNADRVREERRLAAISAEQALLDELTGLGNRRYTNALLDSLQPGDAVVLADFDHFKAVNDTFGHEGGDQVLVDFADLLRRCLRPVDGAAGTAGRSSCSSCGRREPSPSPPSNASDPAGGPATPARPSAPASRSTRWAERRTPRWPPPTRPCTPRSGPAATGCAATKTAACPSVDSAVSRRGARAGAGLLPAAARATTRWPPPTRGRR